VQHTEALAGAEIYDFATNSWAPAGHMAAPRIDHTSSLLQDGRVLVVGGWNKQNASTGQPEPLATAEVYDPETNSWTSIAPMREPRAGQTATLLPSGRVLVLGGGISNRQCVGSENAEEYEPRTDEWVEVSSLQKVCGRLTATLLLDSDVLVLHSGGAARYEPETNLWQDVATSPPPETDQSWRGPGPFAAWFYGSQTATALDSEDVLVVVGQRASTVGGTYDASNRGYRYDPVADSWTRTPDMLEPIRNPQATPLPDGRVLVMAQDARDKAMHAEIYSPRPNERWTAAGEVDWARGDLTSATATPLDSGEILAIGGGCTFLYNPSTNVWSGSYPSGARV
jgi:N-acetylneuraminic acid mutarotase